MKAFESSTYRRPITVLFLTALGLFGCNLEQEVNLDLPEFEEGVVVESYLEAGRPFALLLTRSASYFDPFPSTNQQFVENILVEGATVSITHRGRKYSLENRLFFDSQREKIFNYSNQEVVPQDFDSTFTLHIALQEGGELRAETNLLPVIPIDSIVVEFRERDTLARVLTYLTDPPGQENYYRRLLNQGALDSIPVQDFTTDDRFVEDVLVFGSGYEFGLGDTVFNTVYHIDQAYYDFLESLQFAILANGNPFAQPSPILSNIEGSVPAIGIFTGLAFDRRATVIEK